MLDGLELGEPTVDLWVVGEPAVQGSKSIGASGQMYESGPGWKGWRQTVTRRAEEWVRRRAGWVPLDEPLVVSVEFAVSRDASTPRWRWWPWRKRRGGGDLSKLIRAVEDSLTGVVWADDARVVHYRDVGKRYVAPEEPPHAHIRVWAVGYLERGWAPTTLCPLRAAVMPKVSPRTRKRSAVSTGPSMRQR